MSTISLSISIGQSALVVGEIVQHLGSYSCKLYKTYEINNLAAADELVKQWADAMLDFCKPLGAAIGVVNIAMPGPFDYVEGISYIKENRKLETIYGENIRKLLAKHLNIAENRLYFYNDAVCALTAEIAEGEMEREGVLGLYFDEGFGSALLQGGKIKDMDLWDEDFSGAKTEDFFSVKWFRKNYFHLTGFNILSINDNESFSSPTGKELFKAFTDNLATYIKSLVEKQLVTEIVLGGAVLALPANNLSQLKRRLSALGVNIPLVKAKLGLTAPLIGAAVQQDKELQ